jgi:hypothetical protein
VVELVGELVQAPLGLEGRGLGVRQAVEAASVEVETVTAAEEFHDVVERLSTLRHVDERAEDADAVAPAGDPVSGRSALCAGHPFGSCWQHE